MSLSVHDCNPSKLFFQHCHIHTYEFQEQKVWSGLGIFEAADTMNCITQQVRAGRWPVTRESQEIWNWHKVRCG